MNIRDLSAAVLRNVTLGMCVAACLFASCEKENEAIVTGDVPRGAVLQVETDMQGFGVEGQPGTRATVGAGKTTFETGDAIGVFAVKGSTLVTDCNNVKLTLQSNGKWTGADIYDYGASYFAYYPYSSEMNSKTSVAAIKDAFVISNVQHTAELLAANDLMTATGIVSGNNLILNFTHAFCLLEFNAPKNPQCSTGTQAHANWSFKFHRDATLKAIKLHNGSTGGSWANAAVSDSIAVYSAGNDIYRCIVKPTTIQFIALNYYMAGAVTWNRISTNACHVEHSASFAAGNYYKMNIKSIHFAVLEGDFFYKDGSILPRICTTDLDAGNCVGIVKDWTTADIINKYIADFQSSPIKNALHGYVVALHDAANGSTLKFGESLDFSSANDEQGYATTQKLASQGANKYPAAYAAKNYNGTLPSITNSGWFLSKEFSAGNFPREINDINNSLRKIGGTLISGNYWVNNISISQVRYLSLYPDMSEFPINDFVSPTEYHKVRATFAF